MNVLLAHTVDTPARIFPRIAHDLYERPNRSERITPEQRAALKLIALATRPLSRRQRLSGWRLDAEGQCARLIYLHKMALAAECAGQWRRADDFWLFARDQLEALDHTPHSWETIVQLVATEGARASLARSSTSAEAGTDGSDAAILNSSIELRRRFVQEILIDTHCAFYNSHAQGADPLTLQSRAFAHVEYILHLLKFTKLSKSDLQTIIAPALETWLNSCEESKQWERALQVGTYLIEYLPDVVEYQDRMAKLVLAQALTDQQPDKAPKANLKHAEILQKSIDRLQRLLQQFPYNLTLYEALSHIHYQRAISLANGGQLSEAILSVQKALTYYPSYSQAKELRGALINMMSQLQARAQAIQSELARRHNARLTAEGARMINETKRGLQPVNAYIASEEAKKVSADYATAQWRHVWQAVGLEQPDDHWDEQAQALTTALSQIVNEPPASQGGLPDAWEKVAANQPELRTLDAARVCAFLARRLFSDEQAVPLPNARSPQISTQEPPLISGAVSTAQRGHEPFSLWLFSHHDKRIKLLAVAAVLAVFVIGGLTLQEFNLRFARDAGYNQMLEAAQRQDYAGVLVGAEAYLSNAPVSGPDERDSNVRDIYRKAFVRWFVGLEGQLDPQARAHIQRYQTLMVSSDQTKGSQP